MHRVQRSHDLSGSKSLGPRLGFECLKATEDERDAAGGRGRRSQKGQGKAGLDVEDLKTERLSNPLFDSRRTM